MSRTLIAALATASLAVGFPVASRAATTSLRFDTVVAPPSVPMAGASPWLDMSIQDTATPGTVEFTLTTSLIGAQTLTGVWLNIPSVAGAITSVSIDPGADGSGEDPFTALASLTAAPTNSQSAVRTLQDLHPSGATKAQVGDYNILFRFPNTAGAFQGTESETFRLVTNPTSGLSAASFLAPAAKTAGGFPTANYLALASFTNADGATGTAGSGIAYIAAIVPEPSGFALLTVSALLAGAASRRRQSA